MRISALIKRIFQQMLRDKRTLGLLFIAPLIILTLMNYIFNSQAVKPTLGIVNLNQNLVEALEKSDITIKKYEVFSNETVINDNLDGMLTMDNNKLLLTLQNNDPNTSKALIMKINQSFSTLSQSILTNSPAITTFDINYLYGNSETNFFDILSPILIGFFVFFFVFLISGIGLLRERTTGTLERLMSTPIHRSEVITGYLVGYGIFAIIQTIIVVLFSINILKITLVGSVWYVLLINLLIALSALSLGILLSTFAASEFQMMQFIPIIVIPQIFFAGIFPIESMPVWLQAFARIMPLYYGADALKIIMYKGLGISSVLKDITALIIFISIFILLNIITLKKYRKV